MSAAPRTIGRTLLLLALLVLAPLTPLARAPLRAAGEPETGPTTRPARHGERNIRRPGPGGAPSALTPRTSHPRS